MGKSWIARSQNLSSYFPNRDYTFLAKLRCLMVDPLHHFRKTLKMRPPVDSHHCNPMDRLSYIGHVYFLEVF